MPKSIEIPTSESFAGSLMRGASLAPPPRVDRTVARGQRDAMAAPIDFYFDFVSPYAYLGWTQIHALAARHGRTVRAVPTLFAALLNHSGTLGPAEIPLKRVYIFKDALRTAKVFGVPLEPPP